MVPTEEKRMICIPSLLVAISVFLNTCADVEKPRVFTLADGETNMTMRCRSYACGPTRSISPLKVSGLRGRSFNGDALSYDWFDYGEAGVLLTSSGITGQPVPIKNFD